MKRFRTGVFFLVVFSVFASHSFATTWAPKEFSCPIDNEKNTFRVVMSYGSYIYSWPSKYQWLFWPNTDSPTFYMCKKCHLTTFMWDWEKLPKEKLPEIKKVVDGIKFTRTFKDYLEVPVTERLEVLEKIYSVLDKDAEFWDNFYRIKGYHYGAAGDATVASDARKRSLEIITKKLADEKDRSSKKLLFYISASMKHFLGDDAGALADFEKALKTKYAEANAKPDEVTNAENGLNERIADYITKIKSEKEKPRLSEKADAN